MFLVYTPEGGEAQRFEFNPGRVRMDEQSQIERRYAIEVGEHRSFQQFVIETRQGYAGAVRVLLFFMLRRQHPSIRYEDVNPYGDEIEVLYHKAELLEQREVVEAMPSGAERDAFLAKLDLEIRRAPDADPDGEPGKATGPSSSTGTSNSVARRSPRRGRSAS